VCHVGHVGGNSSLARSPTRILHEWLAVDLNLELDVDVDVDVALASNSVSWPCACSLVKIRLLHVTQCRFRSRKSKSKAKSTSSQLPYVLADTNALGLWLKLVLGHARQAQCQAK